MRKRHLGGVLVLAVGLATMASQTRAEIHNGGVDCTDWNGTYTLAAASATDRTLLPPAGDTIAIKQTTCAGCEIEITVAGQRYNIPIKTSGGSRAMTIRGRTVGISAYWVDGYGKNWYVAMRPDPMRYTVPYSIREYLLTSFRTVTVQSIIRDPRNEVPLSTFGDEGGRAGRGTKIQDTVDARAVYLLPVTAEGKPVASR